MIQSSSILGNVKSDQPLRKKYEEMSKHDLVERVIITRFESARARMRKNSDKGTDVILTLPSGSQLLDGDIIFLSETAMIIIEKAPESVAMIEINSNLHDHELVELSVRVGHALGNLHRPIMSEDYKIYVPVQADNEFEMLNNLFKHDANHLKIEKKLMVFEPVEGSGSHEH